MGEVVAQDRAEQSLVGAMAEEHKALVEGPLPLAVGALDLGAVIGEREDLAFAEDFAVEQVGIGLAPLGLLVVEDLVDGVPGFVGYPEDFVVGADGDDAIGGGEAAADKEQALVAEMLPLGEVVVDRGVVFTGDAEQVGGVVGAGGEDDEAAMVLCVAVFLAGGEREVAAFAPNIAEGAVGLDREVVFGGEVEVALDQFFDGGVVVVASLGQQEIFGIEDDIGQR